MLWLCFSILGHAQYACIKAHKKTCSHFSLQWYRNGKSFFLLPCLYTKLPVWSQTLIFFWTCWQKAAWFVSWIQWNGGSWVYRFSASLTIPLQVFTLDAPVNFCLVAIPVLPHKQCLFIHLLIYGLTLFTLNVAVEMNHVTTVPTNSCQLAFYVIKALTNIAQMLAF